MVNPRVRWWVHVQKSVCKWLMRLAFWEGWIWRFAFRVCSDLGISLAPCHPFHFRRRHPPQWYSTRRFWMCLWHSATGPCRRVARGWKVQRAVNGRMFEKITWRHSTTFYSWWNIILETDYHWKIGCFCWAIIVVGRVQTYLVGPCWLSKCIFAQKGPHKYLYIPHGSHQDSSKFWV